MSFYDSLCQYLRTALGWTQYESPAPVAVDDYCAEYPGITVEEVAAVLDGYLHDHYDNTEPPYGYAGSAYEWARYEFFSTGKEYWELNTQIALGMTVETPVPHQPGAKDVATWWAYQDHNDNYLGYPLLDLDTPEGAAEKENRWNAALTENVPAAWQLAGLTLVYQILTREGMLKKWVTPGFAPPSEYLGGKIENFYGLSAQQILDNLWGEQAGKGHRWLVGGGPNPAWKP